MYTIRDDDRPKRKGCSPWVLGCVGIPLLVIAGCLALAGGGWYFAMHSMPKQIALTRAASDPRVREALGSPVQIRTFGGQNDLSYQFGDHERRRQVAFTIPISGPKGEGTMRAEAEKHVNGWVFQRLEVSIAGASAPIDLRNERDRQEQRGPQPAPDPPARTD